MVPQLLSGEHNAVCLVLEPENQFGKPHLLARREEVWEVIPASVCPHLWLTAEPHMHKVHSQQLGYRQKGWSKIHAAIYETDLWLDSNQVTLTADVQETQ